ncbi:DNA polymerase III subunit gamma/tau [Methylocella sp. CPCC 101449]|uniref:DNA polymerase III subunit gamma/tau n=1 Tax=Methylocella sp. CPCC 101449 TaxID=2987531 RepID=UPI00288ECE9A|nr:DNA polymerase III subunit gamma/tau [Methylocella sp. CPCC 101449]MDT2019776.1 DNA polymerase III subunit gamma/tau [Methylocella sp. CPCC 101449]
MTDGRDEQTSEASTDEPGLGLDLGLNLGTPPQTAGSTGAYRVLARKYRPSSFDDLIGQEAMVRTLTNAFKLNRIHQAYLLTGVRGVGKTTTARILARAFNYELSAKDGHPAIDRPSIDMPELGVHCQAIIESRHVDVIEMDAASHTGVDDVREIIEGARYRPVMARYKVYIIDEVHMLSKSAFNALLKTLEEPPEHVKFLFATTESEKVPVTVRSRCQRFDLRRVESDVLIGHLGKLCSSEKVDIDERALSLIARAAEGSVRDSLSLLDQAIAHAADGQAISAESIRTMLGTGDRSRILDLFQAVMKGDISVALEGLKELYDQGADPALVLTDLAEFIHFVTRLKLAPDSRLDASISQDERTRGRDFADTLSIGVLTRAWQIISKGILDVKSSPRPLAAADMVLVRLAYATDLPSPEDVLRRLTDGPGEGPAPARVMAGNAMAGNGNGGGAMAVAGGARPALATSAPAPRAQVQASSAPRVQLARFEDVVALAQVNRDIQLKIALERDVRLVRFEQGSIEFALAPGASAQLAVTLSRKLQDWTGQRWMAVVVKDEGAPSIVEQREARRQDILVGVRADPLVRSVLERFPGAEIVGVKSVDDAPPAPEPMVSAGPSDDEIGYADDSYTEDDL